MSPPVTDGSHFYVFRLFPAVCCSLSDNLATVYHALPSPHRVPAKVKLIALQNSGVCSSPQSLPPPPPGQSDHICPVATLSTRPLIRESALTSSTAPRVPRTQYDTVRGGDMATATGIPSVIMC